MECSECAEEFRMWEESAAMVRSLRMDAAPPVHESDVQRSVMARIYAEDSWYLPVKERTYQWSASFRRGAAAAMACCLAMFVSAFFFLVFGGTSQETSSEQVAKLTGLLDTSNASDGASPISIKFYQDVPVASISDPLVLQAVPNVPEYWAALSILGMIMTLLTINWLSRTRT